MLPPVLPSASARRRAPIHSDLNVMVFAVLLQHSDVEVTIDCPVRTWLICYRSLRLDALQRIWLSQEPLGFPSCASP